MSRRRVAMRRSRLPGHVWTHELADRSTLRSAAGAPVARITGYQGWDAETLFYNVHLGNFVPGGPANAWRTKRAAMRFAEGLVSK